MNKVKSVKPIKKHSQDSLLLNLRKQSTNKPSLFSKEEYNLSKINSTDGNYIILSLLGKILLFKKEVDTYFFRDKLKSFKFHLNNIAAIIGKFIKNLQNKLITECEQIKEDNNDSIIYLLNNFSKL